jgi:hypothetical protein
VLVVLVVLAFVAFMEGEVVVELVVSIVDSIIALLSIEDFMSAFVPVPVPVEEAKGEF